MFKCIEVIDILKDGVDVKLDIYNPKSYDKTIQNIRNINNIMDIINNNEFEFKSSFNVKVSTDTNIILTMKYDTVIVSISTGMLDLLSIDQNEFKSIKKTDHNYIITDFIDLQKMLFLIQKKLIVKIGMFSTNDSVLLYNNISKLRKVDKKYKLRIIALYHKNIAYKVRDFFVSKYTDLKYGLIITFYNIKKKIKKQNLNFQSIISFINVVNRD